jgi:hypothetical protein
MAHRKEKISEYDDGLITQDDGLKWYGLQFRIMGLLVFSKDGQVFHGSGFQGFYRLGLLG